MVLESKNQAERTSVPDKAINQVNVRTTQNHENQNLQQETNLGDCD